MALRSQKIQMGQNKITGLSDGTDPLDAINLGQLDTEVAALQAEIDALAPASVANNTIQSNVSGSSAVPSANTITQVLDATVGNTRGSILYRGASTWTKLDPGTSGHYLKTQGSGADPVWSAVPPQNWERIVKSSDQSLTSSTAFTDVSGLTFSVSANTRYIFRFVLFLTYGAGGLQIAANGPSSPSLFILGNSGGFATQSYDTGVLIDNSGVAGQTGPIISGQILNGANAGTLAARFRQNASNATATVVRAGSYLEYALIS